MAQLLEIYHTAQEGCIFFGNMYNELRKVMGVVTRSCTFSGEGRWQRGKPTVLIVILC